MQKLSNDDIQNGGIALIDLLNKAIQSALKGTFYEGSSGHVRNAGLDLLNALFEKDQGVKEAIQAATKEVIHKNAMVRITALRIFKALVEKNYAFKNAAEVAAKYITDNNGM